MEEPHICDLHESLAEIPEAAPEYGLFVRFYLNPHNLTAYITADLG